MAGFNPSYTGCATGSCVRILLGRTSHLVSILLILDVLLEVCRDQANISGRQSFNPSYTGCATGRITMGESLFLDYVVSILLILDVLLEVPKAEI